MLPEKKKESVCVRLAVKILHLAARIHISAQKNAVRAQLPQRDCCSSQLPLRSSCCIFNLCCLLQWFFVLQHYYIHEHTHIHTYIHRYIMRCQQIATIVFISQHCGMLQVSVYFMLVTYMWTFCLLYGICSLAKMISSHTYILVRPLMPHLKELEDCCNYCCKCRNICMLQVKNAIDCFYSYCCFCMFLYVFCDYCCFFIFYNFFCCFYILLRLLCNFYPLNVSFRFRFCFLFITVFFFIVLQLFLFCFSIAILHFNSLLIFACYEWKIWLDSKFFKQTHSHSHIHQHLLFVIRRAVMPQQCCHF